jgi:protein O-GlcNAc transferase
MPDLSVDQAFRVAVDSHRAGRLQDAIRIYQSILREQPAHADSIHLLGVAFLQMGDAARALLLIDRAIALQPAVAAYHNNRGQALHRLARLDEAGAASRQAIALEPTLAEAHNNLGTYREAKGELAAAAVAYAEALRLRPGYAEAHTNLGNVLKEQGRVEAALLHFRRAVDLQPRVAALHSNLVLALHYQDGVSPTDLAAAHLRAAAAYAESAPARGPALTTQEPSRRLRVGYVSADLRNHSVARFIAPLLTRYDRSAFEVIAYSDTVVPDEVTAEFQRHTTWRDISGCNDDGLVQLIRSDRIDILIDLIGHTSKPRLGAYAAKPAPVQITYLGYPNTTGLAAVDYRVVDARSDPVGTTDRFCTEMLWRLPVSAWCYRAPPSLPPPREAGSSGPITFGSFNTLAKLSDRTLGWWAAILRAVPDSRLLLKAKALNDESTRRVLAERFQRERISPERLVLRPWAQSMREHFDHYREVDVALDSFPYHGTTTTCEALWMGVPVVTLAGETHHSRVGASLLHQVGLDDCVAQHPDDYVRIAVELSQGQRLAALRAELRQRMAGSSLCDEPRFVRDFESMLRSMWRAHCGEPGGGSNASAG